MRCIILAAGYAIRLYPLTENFPKPLLKVGGKTIVDRLISDLHDHTDIDEYIVASNHKFAEQFAYWSKNKPRKVTVLDDGTSTNKTRLGSVKDIWLAVEQFT